MHCLRSWDLAWGHSASWSSENSGCKPRLPRLQILSSDILTEAYQTFYHQGLSLSWTPEFRVRLALLPTTIQQWEPPWRSCHERKRRMKTMPGFALPILITITDCTSLTPNNMVNILLTLYMCYLIESSLQPSLGIITSSILQTLTNFLK